MDKKNDYKEAYKNLINMANALNLIPSSKQGKSLQLALDLLETRFKYDIITLCGSTKFKDDFFRVAEELSLQSKLVLMPTIFSHTDNVKLTDDQIEELKLLHLKKIDISNEIFVINPGDYIGEQCSMEILYAINNNKKVRFLEESSLFKNILEDK